MTGICTIKEYLKKYPIKHFPVDTYPINEADLFNGANEIAIINSDYTKLWNEQLSNIAQDGYNFLNSNACSKLLDKMRIVEESALSVINDDKLIHEYHSEIELNNKREYEMLQNIYNLSIYYPYNKALFICGAQHRKPFMNKIPEFDSNEKLKLNWTFYCID